MKKASIIIIIVSVLSKVLGFIREAVLANVIGTNAISDAFIYAYSLPTTIFSLIAAAFVTGFIPMFASVEAEKGTKKANAFLNNVLNVMLLLCTILCVVFLLFTDLSLSFLLPNASIEQLTYIIPFTQIAIFSLFFTCIIQLMTGFLQIRDAYIFPVLMGFPMNIIVILTIYLTQSLGVNILPYGIVLSYATQAVLIVGFSKYKGYKYQFIIDFNDAQVRKMLILALPLIVGTASGVFTGIINNGIVSGVEGGISYLNYSTKTGGLVNGIFGTAIVSVMYPTISKLISLKDYDRAKEEFGDSLISVLLFILPATVGMIILAEPLLSFIYMRGKFTQSNLELLVPIFVYYCFGLISISVRDLVVRVFYSFRDMKTPMVNSIIILVSQFILGMILFNSMSVKGVTLAFSISNTFGALYLLIQCRNLFDNFPLKKYFIQLFKLLVASLIMGATVFITYSYLTVQASETVSLFASILIGVIVYLVAILISGVDVVKDLLNIFLAKKNNKI